MQSTDVMKVQYRFYTNEFIKLDYITKNCISYYLTKLISIKQLIKTVKEKNNLISSFKNIAVNIKLFEKI